MILPDYSDKKPLSRNKALLIMFVLAVAGGFCIAEITRTGREMREACPWGQVHKIDHEGHRMCGFQ